jgi:hypothetical protein
LWLASSRRAGKSESKDGGSGSSGAAGGGDKPATTLNEVLTATSKGPRLCCAPPLL